MPDREIMDEHLSAARLVSTDRTPEERAHLGTCARCRVAERRIQDFVALGVDPGPWSESAAGGPSPTGAQLEPGTTVDRYLVESVLGEGGMAVVYRVRHVQLGSAHALKVLKLPSQAIRERLLTE